MTVSNTEKKIIILAANGFEENHMTAIQRALTQAKLTYNIVAPEQGLVNGWQDNAWGHYFTVDVSISAALGSDYDALILVGGERSVAKLKQNPHARRIVNHFVEAAKPVSAIGAGVSLLALSSAIANRTLAVEASLQNEMKLAQVIVAPQAQEQDAAILSSAGEDVTAWVDATVAMIEAAEVMLDDSEAAAA